MTVYFCFDCDGLTGVDTARLQRLAAQLSPGASVVVEGHADSTGGDAYNNALSARRASTVRDVLASSGAAVRAEEHGERRPTGRGAEADRRVEVSLDPGRPE